MAQSIIYTILTFDQSRMYCIFKEKEVINVCWYLKTGKFEVMFPLPLVFLVLTQEYFNMALIYGCWLHML